MMATLKLFEIGYLYLLLFIITNSTPLTISSCCHLKSIDVLWNPLNQSSFYFELTVDNNPLTLQTSILFNPPDGLSSTNIDSIFCWEYSTENISITTFQPNSALNIQIRMKNSTQLLNAFTTFQNPQIITESHNSFDNLTINLINFNLYHSIKMTNTLLKISNRNFIFKRNCFKLYSICFYEIDKYFPDCLDIDSLISAPLGATATVFKDISTTTYWTPTPEDISVDIETGIKCYQPYQQYVLFDISLIEFTSIGLGLLQSISNDTIGLNTTSPRYFSLIFGDKTVIGNDYDNDVLYDQYWVVDLQSDVFINQGTYDEPFYNINPLYFQLDTAPSNNKIRMNQIYFGRPEQYLIGISLFRFGGSISSEISTFTTWTWIGSADTEIYDDGSPDVKFLDNQTFKIGQYAQIACKSAINYDTDVDYIYYDLSSIKPTSEDNKCYGTASKYGITSSISITTCVIQNSIYYPPMSFRLDSNNDNAFYGLIDGFCEYCAPEQNMSDINSFDECTVSHIKQCDGPDRVGSGYVQCDSSEPGASDDVPYSFECILDNITQIYTAYPTPSPTDTPTLVPTLNPSEIPTQAPYTPGTPSRAPTTSSPSANPSAAPTGLTSTPSLQPTNATETPTNNPSMEPIAFVTFPIETIATQIITVNSEVDDDDDDPDNPFDWHFGLVELILLLIILCACFCLCLLWWLAKRSRKKKSDLKKQDSTDLVMNDNDDDNYNGNNNNNNNNNDDDDDIDDNQFGQSAQYQSTRYSMHSNQYNNDVELHHKTSYAV